MNAEKLETENSHSLFICNIMLAFLLLSGWLLADMSFFPLLGYLRVLSLIQFVLFYFFDVLHLQIGKEDESFVSDILLTNRMKCWMKAIRVTVLALMTLASELRCKQASDTEHNLGRSCTFVDLFFFFGTILLRYLFLFVGLWLPEVQSWLLHSRRVIFYTGWDEDMKVRPVRFHFIRLYY